MASGGGGAVVDSSHLSTGGDGQITFKNSN